MNRVGLGLVGCGRFGRRLAEAVSQIPAFHMIGVCDAIRETADRLGEEFGVPAYADYNDLLTVQQLDAILVATSHDTHCPIAVAAAKTGRHVFCEKPMALSVAECREMIRNAEANNVKLLIGQVMRELPLVREVHRLLLSSGLGEPIAMASMRYQPVNRRGWWTRRAQVGGLLHSPGIHNLDLMNWFLGRAVSVYAQAAPRLQKDLDYPDTIFMQVRYESGAIGSLAASISDPSNPPAGTNWGQITCARGAIEFDLVGEGNVAYRVNHGPSIHITLAGESPSLSEGGASHALNAELSNFAGWIRGTAEPFIRPSEAAGAVELCEAAYLSIERGDVVSLPLSGRG